jgi:hypothetical protein
VVSVAWWKGFLALERLNDCSEARQVESASPRELGVPTELSRRYEFEHGYSLSQ